MFRMIGYYEMARDGDIIRVKSEPEFNLEAAQQYAREMLECIAQMPPRFATLVEFSTPPIIGPEVEEAMHRSAFQRAERGLAAVAFVTQGADGLSVADAQWRRIYAGTGVEFRTFLELASAQAWLRERIDRAA
jgi:hypothetical protein